VAGGLERKSEALNPPRRLTPARIASKGTLRVFNAHMKSPDKRRRQAATSARADRPGLTKVEVVVIVAVLGMFAALIVPALQDSGPAPRVMCMNNMRQLGMAIIIYENSYHAYPGYLNTQRFNTPVLDADGTLHATWPVGWPVTILAQLDRSDLARRWQRGDADGAGTWLDLENNKLLMEAVWSQEYLHCPSDFRDRPSGQAFSYAVNSGQADVRSTATTPADWLANGVFVNRYQDPDLNPGLITKMSPHHIRDGLEHTLLLIENYNAALWDHTFRDSAGRPDLYAEKYLGCVWWAAPIEAEQPLWCVNGTGPARGGLSTLPPHEFQGGIEFARPSSSHRGGVNVMFCDSSNQFLSDSIDYTVYCLLMSSDGAQTAPPPGSPFPNIEENYSRFRTGILVEDDFR